ncbi:MAG TPA: alkaline phosphatase family protein [Thermoanaerobaculia bacterium]|nr:alkaline phosphatase family protein [Thermoanaerobaculia bacterium]
MGRLVILACLLAACHEAPPAPGPSAVPRLPELAAASRPGRPVLFVGLDGADWQLLDRYLARGGMPNLARLAREGRTGVLRTRQPPLSPLLWTTMMTGVGPLEHRILDFTRRDPATGAESPIGAAERRAPAVWNMASWAGRTVAVFGLWATWPAEPVNGLLVADRLASFTAPAGAPPAGVAFPPARGPWARAALAAAEREVDFAALRAYLPWLDRAAYEEAAGHPDPYAQPAAALRRILVETRAWHRLASGWIGEERPDLALVYLQGTDTIGHVFAPFAPPRQPAVSPDDFARWSRVPERYFAEVDRLLGDYRRLAERAGAVLVLASDHGFLWGEGRPEGLASAAAATAGRWHREEGVYVLWGPGIQAGDRETGSIDQVCATLLALLGLPPGKGLAGPPLPGAPSPNGAPFDYAAHFRPVPRAAREAPVADDEELAKLRALGYLPRTRPRTRPSSPGDDPTRTPASWNHEGLLLRQAGRTAEARRAFERALALDPEHASALWNLSQLLWAAGDRDRADELLRKALAAGLPDGAERALERAFNYGREGHADRRSALLAAALAARPDEPRLLLARGHDRLQRKDCAAARADFAAAARGAPADAAAHAALGVAELCLGHEAAARDHFRRSLALDPAQPEIRRYLE